VWRFWKIARNILGNLEFCYLKRYTLQNYHHYIDFVKITTPPNLWQLEFEAVSACASCPYRPVHVRHLAIYYFIYPLLTAISLSPSGLIHDVTSTTWPVPGWPVLSEWSAYFFPLEYVRVRESVLSRSKVWYKHACVHVQASWILLTSHNIDYLVCECLPQFVCFRPKLLSYLGDRQLRSWSLVEQARVPLLPYIGVSRPT
jgi:hypothetical protein